MEIPSKPSTESFAQEEEENLYEIRRGPPTGNVISLTYAQHRPTHDLDDYLERLYGKIRKEIDKIPSKFAEIVIVVHLTVKYDNNKEVTGELLQGGSYVIKLYPARSARIPKLRPLSDLLVPSFERITRKIMKDHARKLRKRRNNRLLEITDACVHFHAYRTVEQVKARGRVRGDLMTAINSAGGAARLELAKEPFYSIDKFYSQKLYCKTCQSVIARTGVKRHCQSRQHQAAHPNSSITNVPMVLWFGH